MELKKDHALVVINPFVVYIGLAIIASLLQLVIPLTIVPAGLAKGLAGVFILLNLAFGLPAIRGMLQAKTSPNPKRPSTTLVLTGVYLRTRNPMYVGLTLIFVGILTFFQNGWGFVLTPVLVWLITIWVIIPEEKYLAEKFGLKYLDYKASVRRWI
jgi:protein-S-isoprenylcysteine O-methyltransferase Ste14